MPAVAMEPWLRARQLPCPWLYISTQAPAPHFLLLPPPLASLALPQTTSSNQHKSCPVSSHQPSICGTRLPLPASPVPPSRSYSRRSRLLPTSVLCRLGTQPQLYSTSPHTQVAASGCSPINPQRPVSIRLNLKKKKSSSGPLRPFLFSIPKKSLLPEIGVPDFLQIPPLLWQLGSHLAP